MSYCLDANVFLRFIVKEDEAAYRDCTRLFQHIKERKLTAFTTDLILAEVHWVLRGYYGFDKVAILRALTIIVSQPTLTFVNSVPWFDALALYRGHNVKFIDAATAALLQLPEWRDSAIVSYDRDFDKLGVKRLEPKQVVG